MIGKDGPRLGRNWSGKGRVSGKTGVEPSCDISYSRYCHAATTGFSNLVSNLMTVSCGVCVCVCMFACVCIRPTVCVCVTLSV